MGIFQNTNTLDPLEGSKNIAWIKIWLAQKMRPADGEQKAGTKNRLDVSQHQSGHSPDYHNLGHSQPDQRGGEVNSWPFLQQVVSQRDIRLTGLPMYPLGRRGHYWKGNGVLTQELEKLTTGLSCLASALKVIVEVLRLTRAPTSLSTWERELFGMIYVDDCNGIDTWEGKLSVDELEQRWSWIWQAESMLSSNERLVVNVSLTIVTMWRCHTTLVTPLNCVHCYQRRCG